MSAHDDTGQPLTPALRRVLEGLASGLAPAEIAEVHGISRKRVWDLSAEARVALGATTNEQAVAIAVASGIVEVDTGQGARMRKARALVAEAARLLDPAA